MVKRALLVSLLVLAGVARAQDPLAERKLGPEPGQLVARSELSRATGVKVEVRWDPASGCPSSVRFTPPLALEAEGPEAAAREALERVAPLFGGLAHDRQADAREPKLRLLGVQPFGQERHVRFEQRLTDVPLDGARLVVSLARLEGRTVVRSIAGRAFRDAPPALPAGTRPGDTATPVLTPRGGAWRLAWRTTGLSDGLPVEVLTTDDGVELSREEAVERGAAKGTVFPRYRAQGSARRPLRDLTVVVGGQQVTTGDGGGFPGGVASLPAGLTGPHERVLPRAGAAYPSSGKDGALALDFADGDMRLTEVNVFHHLVEFRRRIGQIPGMPASALDKQVVVRTSDQQVNAGASSSAVTVEGRTYDYSLVFGYEVGLDASVIGHERGHAVLYGLGVMRPFSGDQQALHEAYGDYLAAVYTGDPELRFHGAGLIGRSLSEDRVYPQHWTSAGVAYHDASLVYSGALWDARGAAGADAALVDAAAMRVIPAAIAAGGAQVRDVARELLAGADAKVQAPLETALRLHGLLETDGAAPVVETTVDTISTLAGRQERSTVRGFDAAERAAGRETQVTLLVSAPGFVTVTRPAARAGVRVEDEVALALAPRAGDVGRHVITITAQSALTGRTSVRTIAVTVSPSDAPYAGTSRRTIQAQVGQVVRTPLVSLFDDLQGATPATREPYRFMTSGHLSAGAAVVGSDLVVSPLALDRGTHTLHVHAEVARADREPDRTLTSVVTLVVGDAQGEVVVHRSLASPTLGEEWFRQPPGEPIVVEAGGADRLALSAELRLTSTAQLRGATLELEGAPAAVTTSTAPFPYRVSAPYGSPELVLDVRPPADTRVTTWTFDVVLRQGTTELARRTLVIQVIRPTGKPVVVPPPVVAPPPVVLPPPPVVVTRPPVVPPPPANGPTPGPGIVGILSGGR